MKNKILGVEWRSGRDSVGIVAVEHDYGWCAYIGVAKANQINIGSDIIVTREPLAGDEKRDAQYIRSWGAKLSKEEALVFFPWLKDKADEYTFE